MESKKSLYKEHKIYISTSADMFNKRLDSQIIEIEFNWLVCSAPQLIAFQHLV